MHDFETMNAFNEAMSFAAEAVIRFEKEIRHAWYTDLKKRNRWKRKMRARHK